MNSRIGFFNNLLDLKEVAAGLLIVVNKKNKVKDLFGILKPLYLPKNI